MISHTILWVEVTGNTLLNDDQIAQATTPFIGKDLSLDEINHIVTAITDAYRKNRFFLVQVYIPEQEIKAGKVRVAVLEGGIGNLKVSGNRFYQTSFIRKHFDLGGNLESLKQAALLLNDYPDLQAELFFKPGTVPGTADLEVVVKDEQPMHLSLDYNNFGSKAVSRSRFGIGVDMGNLIQDGQVLSLHAVFGSPLRGFAYYQGSYMAPYGYTGNNVHFTYARGDFDGGEELSRLNDNMETESFAFSLSRPFLKTHLQELLGEVGFEANNFSGVASSQNRSVRDRMRVVRGRAAYQRFSEETRDFLSITLTQGLGSLLGGTENGDNLTSRPGADDLFTKGTIDWVRVRSIPQPYFIPHRYSLMIAGSAQVSSDSLVVSEQFAGGGADAVRGYPVGAFLGEDGYRFSTELRISPFPDPEKIQAAIFLDHGGSFTKKESAHFLTGLGLGVRVNFPGAITLQEPDRETEAPGYRVDYRFQMRADIGFPVSERSLLQGGGPIFYLQAVGRF